MSQTLTIIIVLLVILFYFILFYLFIYLFIALQLIRAMIRNWYNLIPNFLIISQGKESDFVATISLFWGWGEKLFTTEVPLLINIALSEKLQIKRIQ